MLPICESMAAFYAKCICLMNGPWSTIARLWDGWKRRIPGEIKFREVPDWSGHWRDAQGYLRHFLPS